MPSEIYNEVMNNRNKALERLLEIVPGYEGYRDMQARRAADRVLREHMAARLRQRIDRMAQIERKLLDQDGGLAFMSATSSAKTKLQTYHDRVSAAAPGYSGFFAAVKIDADALELLHGFDELQTVYADRFASALDEFEAAVQSGDRETITTAIAKLDSLTIEANGAFDERENAIKNLDSKLGGL